MSYYLRMDGVDDYLKTPILTFTRIELKFKPKLTNNGAFQYYFDARSAGGVDCFYVSGDSGNINGTIPSYRNEVQVINPVISGFINPSSGDTELLRFDYPSPLTTEIFFFTRYTMIQFAKADVFDIKVYNGVNLVAHYDMGTGSVSDQSGNGNSATLTGGVWGQTASYLQMDGVDDALLLANNNSKRIVIDMTSEADTTTIVKLYLRGNGNYELRRNENGTDYYDETKISKVTVNGVQVVNNTNFIPERTRTVVDVEYSSVNFWDNSVFAANDGMSGFIRGKIYSIKFYDEAGVIVAYYDMSTGTVLDQSGRGRHGNLIGGTWGTHEVADHLSMNGTTDLIKFNHLFHFDEVVMDAVITEQDEGSISDFVYLRHFYASSYNSVNFQKVHGRYRFSNMTVYVNGTSIPYNDPITTYDSLTRYRIVSAFSPTTPAEAVTVFGKIKGSIYEIKFYLQGIMVAHYDMTTGTLFDQTGNNNHAELVGGTWAIVESESPIIPEVTIESVSRSKISDELQADRSVVTFLFNEKTVEWVVRVTGTSPQTGILADSYVGDVDSGTPQSAEIDWTECYQEGENRVNIYGKNANGEWTPYERVALPSNGNTTLTFSEQ